VDAGTQAGEQDRGGGLDGQRGRPGAAGGRLAGGSAPGVWIMASERDSSMQPMATAITAAISTASSQPPVWTSSP
jgi:hypothetical protein